MGMKVKASKGGDFEDYIPPPAGPAVAVLVAIIDLGTQDVTFGAGAREFASKVYFVWELTGKLNEQTGKNHVIGSDFRVSLNEKANLRKLIQNWIGRNFAEDEEYDITERLGKPCLLTIAHKSGKGENANKTYANIAGCTAVPQEMAGSVKAPQNAPFFWSLDDGRQVRNKQTKALEPTGDKATPEDAWLPRIYGKTVADTIGECEERLKGTAAAGVGRAQANPAAAEKNPAGKHYDPPKDAMPVGGTVDEIGF